MTPEAQRVAIAEACGVADRFVLVKRGLYWRPDGHGYTNNLNKAWLLTESEANKYVYPHDEPIIKEHAPIPDYLSDLNAMHNAEKVLPNYAAYDCALNDTVLRDFDALIEGALFPSHATAAQRAEAFLRTLKLWDDIK